MRSVQLDLYSQFSFYEVHNNNNRTIFQSAYLLPFFSAKLQAFARITNAALKNK